MGGIVFVLASSANADEPERPSPWWSLGPAGGAYGFFVEGGGTAGIFGFESFAAASFGLGASLRWFEASATGHFGGSFDSLYGGGAFLARFAARVPMQYVAFTLGPSLGYVEVPGHLVSGFVFEPVTIGVEIDPICHLRIGAQGAWAQVFGDAPQGALRGALTIGYVMGHCAR
jgi:hypothetical protein